MGLGDTKEEGFMTCYHPLKAFKVGVTKNGKDDLKVVPYKVDHLEKVELNGQRKIIRCYEPVDWSYCPPGHLQYFTDYVEIPCGKCVGCRLDYSRQWANRLLLEKQSHQTSYFITLTYNDDSLNRYCKKQNVSEDGETFVSYSLVKRHFQLFMKRLRKRFPDACIRYYACGEYGGVSRRPHYHAILFGVPFDDLVFFKTNFEGDKYFLSETLAKLWPMGFHLITDASWNTCAYVSRYVVKKRLGDMSDFYDKFGLEPEFASMSLKPGIGRFYYEEHKDEIYSGDNKIRVLDGSKPTTFSPPRYFDNLYDLESPEDLDFWKERRKFAALHRELLESGNTSLDKLDYLRVKESDVSSRIKALKRGDCIEPV